MQSMIDFSTWFLSELPTFMWSEPVRYIWGLALTAYLIRCILSLRHY